MAQTVSNGKLRRIGSAKVEVAAYGSDTWYDLGLGKGIKFTENMVTSETFPDNGDSLGMVIDEQSATISMQVWEPDLAVFNIARGSIDNLTTTAASIVSGHTQSIASGAWAYNQFIVMDGQNGNGNAPTLDGTIPVVGSVDGTLTEVTDFDLVKVSGKWGIIVKDSTAVTTAAQVLTFKYSYTPAASYSLSTGGTDIPGWLKVRLTNVTSGKAMVINFYKCQNTKGFDLPFGADNKKGEPVGWAMEFKAVNDTTRDVKDRLYKITIEE